MLALDSGHVSSAYHCHTCVASSCPIVVNFCWQRIIDNRTGKMGDKGYVNC